jgi:OmpA-OmpF porin, OOP family
VAGAQAQISTSRSGSGFSMYSPGSSYIGFNAGQSDFSLGNGTGLFSGDDKDTAYNIYAGSYFNPYLGLELGYTDFGKAKRGGGNTKAMGFNLSLVGKYPLGTSFNLLGKVGTTYGRTEVSSLPGSGITAGKENGFGLSYGVGAEYLFTPQLSGVIQYDEHRLEFAGTGRDRIGAATLGLRYRF